MLPPYFQRKVINAEKRQLWRKEHWCQDCLSGKNPSYWKLEKDDFQPCWWGMKGRCKRCKYMIDKVNRFEDCGHHIFAHFQVGKTRCVICKTYERQREQYYDAYEYRYNCLASK